MYIYLFIYCQKIILEFFQADRELKVRIQLKARRDKREVLV